MAGIIYRNHFLRWQICAVYAFLVVTGSEKQTEGKFGFESEQRMNL